METTKKENVNRSNTPNMQSPRMQVEDKPFSQWAEENAKLYPSYAPHPVQMNHYGANDMYTNYSYQEHPSPYYIMYPSGQKVLMAPVVQHRPSYSRKPLMERRPSPLQSPNKSNSFGDSRNGGPIMSAHPNSAPTSFHNHNSCFKPNQATSMYADALKPLPPSTNPGPRAYTGKKKRNNAKPVPPRRKRQKMYSDYVGVTFNKTHNKFQACITHFRKQHYLGRYKLATDAAKAYDDSARDLKGPGWKINFPTEKEFAEARKKEEEALLSRELPEWKSDKGKKLRINRKLPNAQPRSSACSESTRSDPMVNNENVENTSSTEANGSFSKSPMEVIASPGRAGAMEAATTLMTLIGAPL
uniref:AP2/ERF domain-containing protein n=1 Tax=Leptocylindrus danicus TaxID=163516 RepID=A0A7S2NY26_9STRA|mmetsp:Transcript_17987/g.26767  ORF Transcript_17987/g.26767 Transcript_17987/m.26767 type:complete len:357 (+) Transcript_17987:224-1294(+)